METKLFSLILILSFCFYMSEKESRNCNEPAFGYKVRTDCNVDSAMYELIDSNRIIDFNFSFGDGSYVQYSPTIQHLKRHDKSSYFPKEYYMIIERETEYAKFKTNHSNNIDFENNILFIVFLDSYGTCIGNRRPEITLSLLLDKMNNNYIVSITHFIHAPYLKVNCPPFMVEAIIPKEYYNLICINSKILCHETENNN